VPDARREARDLVAALLDRPRFWPTAHPELTVDPSLVIQARRAMQRRSGGAPFAYAVGRAAFRSLTLAVDERVLIPRPETELLVDLVLGARRNQPGGVAVDVGTGSGALALALASEGAFERVIATDVSSDAVDLARWNGECLRHRLRAVLEFRTGAGLAPLAAERADVLVCNPPYIAYDETQELPSSVRDWEPAHALVCGDEGLAMTRRLIHDAPRHLHHGGLLALEVDARRAAEVAASCQANGAYRDVCVHRDLTGRERFVLARRGEC
jgi:release factor glutamine methyltransferase